MTLFEKNENMKMRHDYSVGQKRVGSAANSQKSWLSSQQSSRLRELSPLRLKALEPTNWLLTLLTAFSAQASRVAGRAERGTQNKQKVGKAYDRTVENE